MSHFRSYAARGLGFGRCIVLGRLTLWWYASGLYDWRLYHVRDSAGREIGFGPWAIAWDRV